MGIASTKNFKRSANLNFCSEIKDIQKSSSRISASIAKLNERMDENIPKIEEAQKKVLEAKEEVSKYTAISAVKTLTDLQDQLENIEESLSKTEDSLNSCNHSCDEFIANYRDLREERKRLNQEMRSLRRNNRVSLRNYERAKAKLESAESHRDYQEEFVLDILDRKEKLYDLMHGLYKNLGKLEGGTISVNYDLKCDDNVQELESKYSSQGLHFSAVDTQDARLSANFVGANDKDSYYDSLPALLDYTIAGFKYLPYGEQSTNDLVSVPDQIQGDLRLSLIGACPYYYKDFLSSDSLEADTDLNKKEYSYGLSISYMHPAVYRFELEAKYNLYKFYKKVVKSGSSGGLFSSRSWKKVSETKLDKDTFDITWLDEGQKYTREEKEQIRNTVKAELTARVLQNMGHQASSSPGPLVAINTYSPKPGALVLAKGLNKVCGWNFYCKAGSWALKGLTSIFGGSKAEASFQSTHDSTAIEKWNEEEIKLKAGSTSFTEN